MKNTIYKQSMLIKSPHEGKKAAERVGDLELIWNFFGDLPSDTVAQSVDHCRDKSYSWF